MSPQHHNLMLSDLFHGLLLHKRAMLWTFSTVMLIAIALTCLAPKIYTSEAKLYVRLGRESVSLDPTATTSQMVMVSETRENEINSVFELFKSRAVLSSVVAAIGSEQVLGRPPKGEDVHMASLFGSMKMLQPYSVEDAALKHLSNHLNIRAVKKTKVINISYEASTPEAARDVVASLIELGRDAHSRVNRTDGSQEFFATQATHLRDKLNRLETELLELKNSAGVSSLADQRALTLERMADLESALLKTEATISASAAEMAVQRRILDQSPEIIPIGETRGMPHSAVEAMREQLFALQVREKELRSMYTEEHPFVQAIVSQVAEVRESLKREQVEPQVAVGRNPAHQEITLALLKNEASAASLEAHAVAVKSQLLPLRDQLTHLNTQEVQIARLEREIELETANYKKYADNLEQARIDHELEATSISNLNVLQPPTCSLTPTWPRPFLNMAMGAVAALASSVGVGLFLQHGRYGARGAGAVAELSPSSTLRRGDESLTQEVATGAMTAGEGSETTS